MAYKQYELYRMGNQEILKELHKKQEKLTELDKLKMDLQVCQDNIDRIDSELKEGRYKGEEKARKEAELENYKYKMDYMKNHGDTSPSQSVIAQRGVIKGEIQQLESEYKKRDKIEKEQKDVGQEGHQGQVTQAQAQTREKKPSYDEVFDKPPVKEETRTEEKQQTPPNTVLKVTKTSYGHSLPDKGMDL